MEAVSLLSGVFASFAVYYSAKAFSFSREAWSGAMWIAILIFSLAVGLFLASLYPLLGTLGFLGGFIAAFYLGRGARTDYKVTIKDKKRKEGE